MTPAEVAKLLTAAKTMDDRVTPDQERVAGWHATLDPAMPYDFAKEALIAHYRAETRSILPADVMRPWTAHLDELRRIEQGSAWRAIQSDGVPAPVTVLDQVRHRLFEIDPPASAAGREARTVACPHCGAVAGRACTVIGGHDQARLQYRDSRCHPAREELAAALRLREITGHDRPAMPDKLREPYKDSAP